MQARSSPWMAAVRAILVLPLLLVPSLARAQVVIYQYNSTYDVTDTIDQAGNVTAMTYDTGGGGSQDGLVVDSESSGNTRRYYYDTNNHVVQQYTEPGSVTSSTYDSLSGEVVTSDTNDHVTQYTYSDLPTTVTDAAGMITSTEYDAQDRLIIVGTDMGGQTTYTYYDAATGMETATDPTFDPLGSVTATAYDGIGRDMIVATDTGGIDMITVYQYDGTNYDAVQMIPVSDPVTNMVYDSGNNQVIADFPAKSFFDVFTDINIGGPSGVNEFSGTPPTQVDTPDVPTYLAYDSVHNQLFVVVTPESSSLLLIAPALVFLGMAALRGRRKLKEMV